MCERQFIKSWCLIKICFATYLSDTRFGCFRTGMQATTLEHVNTIDINRVYGCSIICQHGSKWTTNNFTSIDNRDNLSVHVSSNGVWFVITSWTLFQNLDNTESSAWQQTLLIICRRIQISHISIKISPVQVTKTFDIAFVRNRVSQIVILWCPTKGFFLSKNGIIHDDTMNSGIFIGINQSILDINWIVHRS